MAGTSCVALLMLLIATGLIAAGLRPSAHAAHAFHVSRLHNSPASLSAQPLSGCTTMDLECTAQLRHASRPPHASRRWFHGCVRLMWRAQCSNASSRRSERKALFHRKRRRFALDHPQRCSRAHHHPLQRLHVRPHPRSGSYPSLRARTWVSSLCIVWSCQSWRVVRHGVLSQLWHLRVALLTLF